MREETCSQCANFMKLDEGWGECRESPPVVPPSNLGLGKFPPVHPDFWCGKFCAQELYDARDLISSTGQYRAPEFRPPPAFSDTDEKPKPKVPRVKK